MEKLELIAQEKERRAKLMAMQIDELELTVRVYNCLKNTRSNDRAKSINNIRDIVSFEYVRYYDSRKVFSPKAFLFLRNFGEKSLIELINELRRIDKDLSLGMDVEKYLNCEEPYAFEPEAETLDPLYQRGQGDLKTQWVCESAFIQVVPGSEVNFDTKYIKPESIMKNSENIAYDLQNLCTISKFLEKLKDPETAVMSNSISIKLAIYNDQTKKEYIRLWMADEIYLTEFIKFFENCKSSLLTEIVKLQQ
jgi:hypothetical protein